MPEQDEAEALPLPTHVYKHPEGLGLGDHHSPGVDLAARPVDPGVPLHHLLPEHRQSMADLDLADGTEVAVTGEDPDHDWVIFEWTDKAGTRRRTSADKATFSEFFTETAK